MIPFFVFIFCLVVVLGAYLLATRGSEKRRARLQERLAEALMTSAHSSDNEIRLARDELISEIPFINRAMMQLSFATRLKRMIEQADLIARYRNALARHQQNWHQACRQMGATMVELIAEQLLESWNLEALVKAELLKV